MKKKSLEYKTEIDRIIEFYKRTEDLPKVKVSYDQYVNLIINDSELDHYQKSELLLYWRGLIK